MKDRPRLTREQIEHANRLLQDSAIEQRSDCSPPFRPRLSKRPAARPLLESLESEAA